MNGIYLLLGTNLGDKAGNLKKAIDILKSHEISIIRQSHVYESAPWGEQNQDWFLNMVLKIETHHDVHELLKACLSTETAMGRTRIKKWGERLIDIDILYYKNQSLETPTLTVPHPGIAMRRFTLMPLCEISPGIIHPVLNLTQNEMLEICPDELECRKLSMLDQL